jgi:hypothetical protein
MQTPAPGDAPRTIPVSAAHCGRSAPGSALLAFPAAARLRRPPELHQKCTMHRLTPAGSPPAVRLADRFRPAPACRSAPAPALALHPLTARHAACLQRVAIVATASRLPGYAVPSGTTPAASPLAFSALPPPSLPPRQRFATASACSKASQGASKLHNEELSAACRLSGSRPDNFRYAKCRPGVTRPRPP